jgi:glycosyltransferase involved in cell wall biosynthesis
MNRPATHHRIVFLGGTAGDWGGASRVLFNTLRMLDRSIFDPVVLLPRDGPAIGLLEQLAIEHLIWREAPEPSAGLFGYFRGVVGAMRMLRDRRAALLDVNFNHWRPADVLAAHILRIPIVTHFHLVTPRPGPFVRYSSAVTAVSRFSASGSTSFGRRLEVVPNTVVLDRFDRAADLRRELGLAAGDVVVSFVGQIRENKGIDSFLRMVHALPHADVRFLIAGECRDPRRFAGSYDRGRLEREIAGDRRVSYLGYREDVERIFRTTDILVVPSRWGEPFGLINIEAGAAGIPVVATRDGGIPEIICDGDNGLLVDVGDEHGLAAAVARLVDDPALRARLGLRARQVVEAEFTTAPVRRLERLYLDLLEPAGAQAKIGQSPAGEQGQ